MIAADTQPLFAVTYTGFRWEALRILRVTPKQVICADGSRERHLNRDNVPLSLGEAAARKVVERLTSSESMLSDDRWKAGLRRNERNAAVIADAKPADGVAA